MKKLVFLPFLLSGCSVMEWSNAYGTDFCVYPSGVMVGVPTAVASLAVASPPVALGVGAAAGGVMMLNGWGNYGGTDIENCKRSFRKIVLKENEDENGRTESNLDLSTQ